MSDRDGILMGVNKANSSLVIVDIFNSEIYKNAITTVGLDRNLPACRRGLLLRNLLGAIHEDF